MFYFVATLLASVVGFFMALMLNRFLNKLDKRMDNYDRFFELMQSEISELKEISIKQSLKIEHIEDKVFPVRYPKK